jgi:hypothetical protein
MAVSLATHLDCRLVVISTYNRPLSDMNGRRLGLFPAAAPGEVDVNEVGRRSRSPAAPTLRAGYQ